MRCLVLVIVAACGTTPAPPPKNGSASGDAAVESSALDQDLPRLATRSLALFTDLAKAFEAAGENCEAATAKLGELTKQYADVVAANAKIKHEGRDLQLKLALRQHEPELDAAAKSIMSSKTLPACAENPAFQKAFDDLRGAPPPS